MNYCAKCGHELGVGRFCTQCGHPIGEPAAPADDWRTDTSERTAASIPPVQPVVPDPEPTLQQPAVAMPTSPPPSSPPPSSPPPSSPPPSSPPPPARFPLFADEVDDQPEATSTYALPPEPDAEPEPEVWAEEPIRHRRSRPWGVWVGVGVVLLLLLFLGIKLLTGGDSGSDAPSADPTTSKGGGGGGGGGGGSKGDQPNVPPGSVTDQASVVVPQTASAGQDVDGNRVTYVGKNMLDGVPETAWRMPGDGTGREITITFPSKTHLTSVGMINGYAKEATNAQGGAVDWYHGNRRVQAVEWTFGDGTTVQQDLKDTTAVQSVDVDVTTTTITLRLDRVSKPGKGPSARNFTAISDLSLISGH